MNSLEIFGYPNLGLAQCCGSASVSMRIRIQNFRSMHSRKRKWEIYAIFIVLNEYSKKLRFFSKHFSVWLRQYRYALQILKFYVVCSWRKKIPLDSTYCIKVRNGEMRATAASDHRISDRRRKPSNIGRQ